MKLHGFAILLVAATLALAACGDDDSDTTEPTPTGQRSSPEAGRSGIEAVDSVLAAVEGGDVDTLVSLMRFTKLACVATPNVPSGEVPCDGESVGTLVETIPIATCEGGNIVRHSAEARLRQLFNERPQTALYGAYRTSGSSFIAEGFFGRGDPLYAVVLASDVSGSRWGWALLMSDTGIVDIAEGCAQTPADFATSWELTDVLLAPNETAQPTAVSTSAPTPDATAIARRSGIPEVDAVIDAMLSGKAQQQRSLVAFQSQACTATAVGIGPFYCGEGEPDGTVSEVIPAVYCEGSFIRKDQFGFSDPTFSVYAVYDNGDARHVILSRIIEPQGTDLGLDLILQQGRIVLLVFGCGDSPADMVRNAAPAGFLLPPP